MASSSATSNHLSTIITLFFFLIPITSSLSSPNTTTPSYSNITYSFPSFTNADNPNFAFADNSSINQGSLQITPDSRNSVFFSLNHKAGRILLSRPFKLFESSRNSTYVASFSTSFKINVFRDNGTLPGDGLAFLIASSTDGPPPNSDGGFLGLTNSTIDGNSTNQFVAIEFDTVKQSYDPNDNHVGLDINSVVSNVTADLTPFGIVIAPVNTTFYTVWIDYSGVTRNISVYMINSSADTKPTTLVTKPTTPVLSAGLDLSAHLNQFSYFGFAASTGSNYELNCVLQWNLTVESLPTHGGWPAWKYAAAIVPPLLFLIIVFVVLGRYLMTRRRLRDDPSMLVSTLKSLPGMPREFTYKELKRATSNFDDRMKLGQGGFGVVYKGVIPGENGEVAVKKFLRGQGSSQNDFLKELTIINRLRHKHLVRLLGWCHKNNVLLLVYELMPNGSLDQHIFAGADRPLLRWDRRYNIIVGLASALHYLHHEFDENVVHRDLKASNVMLDAAFNARLGDFGLARAIPTDKTAYTELEHGGVPGTFGYIAPECILDGKATRQSDVFAFGAVMLEVACGRRPRSEVGGFQFLSDWVWKMYREGNIVEAVDERLNGEFVHAEAERLLLLGLACSHPNTGDRPKMQEIVQVLTGKVPVPKVPLLKPKFVWSSEPAEEDEQSSTATTRLTSIGVNSSYYGSSGTWTPQSLSYDV